jgi:hypothetical protein
MCVHVYGCVCVQRITAGFTTLHFPKHPTPNPPTNRRQPPPLLPTQIQHQHQPPPKTQVPPEQYEAELQSREGATIEDTTRTGGLGPFSGPPKAVLRVVSQGLFWYLQPRVEKICKVGE